MKNIKFVFLFSLLALVLTSAVSAQAVTVDKAAVFSKTDTLTNAGTKYITFPSAIDQPATLGYYLRATRISGKQYFKAYLQTTSGASASDTTWVNVDTVTATAQGDHHKFFQDRAYGRKYRVYIKGDSTQSTQLKSVFIFKRQ